MTVGRALVRKPTFTLFDCQPNEPLVPDVALRPLDFLEVRRVLILHPLTMRDSEGQLVELSWRFPEDRMIVQRLFRKRIAVD